MDQLLDFVLNFYGATPYLIVFGILLLCGLGVPIPEDITLIIGGVLAYYGICDLWIMIAVSFGGVMLGDSIMFWLGAHYGRRLTKKWIFHKLLPDDRLDSVKGRFNRWGNKLIFIARFMPGLRAPIFFSAGTFHLPFRVFFFYDGLAALLSVPAIVGAVYYFGDQLEKVIKLIKKAEYGIVYVVLAGVAFFLIRALVRRRIKKIKAAKENSNSAALLVTALTGTFFFSATGYWKSVAVASPMPTPSPLASPWSMETWCEELEKEMVKLGWKQLDPCQGVQWEVGGRSVLGRPLPVADFGDPKSTNTTLVFSMVHGDENTPLYSVVQLVRYLVENQERLKKEGSRVVVAPMVNPDGFFRRTRTRTNAHKVDLNRNLPTRDWHTHARKLWRSKFGSNARRNPGLQPASEPETRFQQELIEKVRPTKILSIHAPLNFMDYDGPTTLALARFPKHYVEECLKLRKSLKAVSGGFFPGSLGNYGGQELGIPTLTLELPSANAHKAEQYWRQFRQGIQTMIEFKVPEIAQSAPNAKTTETAKKE
jgi:protein MpaA